jgi:hypothetical protein
LAHLTKNASDKSESAVAEIVNLSKSEKVAKLTQLAKNGKLDAEQRRYVNNFCINGANEDKINQILGGSK